MIKALDEKMILVQILSFDRFLSLALWAKMSDLCAVVVMSVLGERGNRSI